MNVRRRLILSCFLSICAAGARTTDLAGKFVTPGIINLHGHVGNTVDLAQDPKNFTGANVERQLKMYASYGVTSVVSMGSEQPLIMDMRAEQRRANRPTMTRIFTARRGFTGPGGYPTTAQGMKGVPYEVATVDEVEKDVAELAAQKVDLVKIWVDDHLGKEGGGRAGRPGAQRSRQTGRRCADSVHEKARLLASRRHSHSRGLHVRVRQAESDAERPVFRAIGFGGRSAHPEGSRVSKESRRLAGRRALGDGAGGRSRPHSAANHHDGHEEFGRVSRRQDLGTLQKGKWADLIVLRSNPLDNIKNARTIEAVWIAGNKVK